MNRYAEYKDSGVEWIGEIPSHWEVKRLATSVRKCINGVWGIEPDGVQDIVCVRVADFDRTKFRVSLKGSTIRSVPMKKRVGRVLEHDDLLLEKSGGGELQPVGVVILFNREINAVCSNFIARMPVNSWCNSNFLTYLHAYLYTIRLNTRSIKQTTGIQNLDAYSYLNEHVAFPPLSEQDCLSQYLDKKTSQIDSLSEKLQRKIELLKEQRTALISQCVTKGIDSNAEMKDSGVEWIGEIPSHWEVKRLATSVRKCINGVWGIEPDGVQDIVCVRVADFDRTKFRVSLKGSTIRSVPMKKRVGRVLEHDDLLLEKSGGGELQPVGVVILFNREINAVCSNFIARMPVNSWCNSNFLTYLHAYLYTIRLNTRSIKQTTGIQNLDAYSYLNEHVAFPPLSEQDCLSQYLDKKTSQIDSLSEKLQRKIELLKEYRQSLISNFVTGKIKVTKDAP